MASGLFGYLGYGMIGQIERLPDTNPDTLGVPDGLLIRPTVVAIFDNIAADQTSVFNLTVQRVRAQGTGQVEDQEIFQRLSVMSGDERYLPRVLAQSALVRLIGDLPDLSLTLARRLAGLDVHYAPGPHPLTGTRVAATGDALLTGHPAWREPWLR